MYSAATYKGAF